MKKYFIIIISLFTLHSSLFTLTSCDRNHYATFSGFEQGTTYTIVVKNPGKDLGGRIDSVFNEIDNTFSMFNPESLVSRINRNETTETTPLFDECFAIARKVYERTGGYYDLTVKPLVDAWGFGPGERQDMPCVDSLMEYVGMDKIRIGNGHVVKDDPRVQLDFSSVAKGFSVDRQAGMLESCGVTDYMVEVGGEVRVKGVNAAGNRWRIGINKPVEGFSQELEAVVTFDDRLRAIATSGNYRNWFTDETGNKRVHTIDAKTGMPAMGNVLSVSVVGSECAVADAWATGLMATHDIAIASSISTPGDLEFFIIFSDEAGEIQVLSTRGFPIEKQ